jgi:hypothetical protein
MAVISWRMADAQRPSDWQEWEAVINGVYGVLGGHVDVAVVVHGERWRVALAKRIHAGAYAPGESFLLDDDVRNEVKGALRAARKPVDD